MRALKRYFLRLADWARVGNFSRLKSLALRARAISAHARVAAQSLHLVTWHPARGRSDLVAKTIALAARESVVLSPAARLIRSIILKPCMSASERGVILVSFETELAKLAGLASLSELERRYAIVFLPTWQPFYSPALFAFAQNPGPTARTAYLIELPGTGPGPGIPPTAGSTRKIHSTRTGYRAKMAFSAERAEYFM